MCLCDYYIFLFKQKTAYEMRISDWSSDVCSSDLLIGRSPGGIRCLAKSTYNMRFPGSSANGGEEFLSFEQFRHLNKRKVRPIVICECAFFHGDEIGRASCRARVGQSL